MENVEVKKYIENEGLKEVVNELENEEPKVETNQGPDPTKCTYHGTLIGINNNVIAYGSCGECDHYTGLEPFEYTSVMKQSDYPDLIDKDTVVGGKWQCVEYARRWLMITLGISFDSVPCAYHIIELYRALNLRTKKFEKFVPYLNGNKSPPAYADLIIIPKNEKDKWGHVAVCTGVNLEKNYIELCEQNFAEYGEKWAKYDEYSRRVIIVYVNDEYILTEVDYSEENVELVKKEQNFELLKTKVIGWMRVEFDSINLG